LHRGPFNYQGLNFKKYLLESVKDSDESYLGELSSQGKRHGVGVLKGHNGSIFEGEWQEGKMHGAGRMLLPNGDCYEGQWTLGKLEGEG
jgi:hypothetical protein